MNKVLKIFVVILVIIIVLVIVWIAFGPVIVQWLGSVMDKFIPGRGMSDMGGIQ